MGFLVLLLLCSDTLFKEVRLEEAKAQKTMKAQGLERERNGDNPFNAWK